VSRVGLLLLVATTVAAQSAPPLPEAEPFFAETRANVARSEREARRFAYTERRTAVHMNPFGRLGTGETRAYRVTPAADGKTLERRLVERDGQPVADAPPERSNVRERPPGRRSSVDDVVAVLTFTMERRERREGRDTVVVRFAPRPNASAETRQGRLARSFTGLIWVDEAAREVARVEATAREDLSIGWGLVARLRRGASVVVTRARADATTWVPTSITLTGEGRAMLVRRLAINHVIEWFDYVRIGE
jgi:hypothetical protein